MVHKINLLKWLFDVYVQYSINILILSVSAKSYLWDQTRFWLSPLYLLIKSSKCLYFNVIIIMQQRSHASKQERFSTKYTANNIHLQYDSTVCGSARVSVHIGNVCNFDLTPTNKTWQKSEGKRRPTKAYRIPSEESL